MNYLKIYLPLFLLLYLLVTFVVPSVRVYRKTGINPVTFGKEDNAHDYIGKIMKVLTGLLILDVMIFSISDPAYEFLVPINYVQADWIRYTGLFLLHASFLWIVIAQYQMKNSWRIGVDEKNKTELITRGLFSISRNPVFLGMIISTAAVFLIIPNAVTFFTAVTTYIIIQIQIRLEEEHLEKQHGVSYSNYRQKVRRLL